MWGEERINRFININNIQGEFQRRMFESEPSTLLLQGNRKIIFEAMPAYCGGIYVEWENMSPAAAEGLIVDLLTLGIYSQIFSKEPLEGSVLISDGLYMLDIKGIYDGKEIGNRYPA